MSKAPPAKRNRYRRVLRAALLAVSAAGLFVGASAFGATTADPVKELKPPFGLSWGETSDRLERLLEGAKAKIVDKRAIEGGKEAWDVEGLVQTGLKRTVFYFRKGELIGVELQYEREGWKDEDYDKFMGEVRRRLEQRYGTGQQIVRRTEPEGTAVQTIVGYQWNLNNTAIELIYFKAQAGENEFRTLSVHYKAF